MGLEPQKILCECLHGEPLHFRYSMRSFMNSTSYALKKKNFILCALFFTVLSRKKKHCLMFAFSLFLGHIMDYILKYYFFFCNYKNK